MDITNFFRISLKKPACIGNLSEDDLRELINSIEITVRDPAFSGIVTSTGDSQVKFGFGSDGGFTGVSTRQNNKFVKLVTGVSDRELFIFEGSPSSSHPPAGFKLEVDLTRDILRQTGSQSTWKAFLASRENVLTIV